MAGCCGKDYSRLVEAGRRGGSVRARTGARNALGRFEPKAPGQSKPAVSNGVTEVCDESAADVVVRIAAARNWPNVRVEELAGQAGVSIDCLKDAVERRKAAVPRPQPSAAVEPENRRRRIRGRGDPPSPEHVWCTYGEGHWVHIDLMARNVARPGGLADWCRPCFDDYRKKRYRRGSITSPASRRPL